MILRMLIAGDNIPHMEADAQMLKDRGITVYTCSDYALIPSMIAEIKPDMVLIDPAEPSLESTSAYHDLLDDIEHAMLPVIYTLAEDDVYLVNRKRTIMKQRRNIIADNIVDAIKLALSTEKNPVKRNKPIINHPGDIRGYGHGNYAA